MSHNFALVISKEYPEDKFNLLTPMKTVADISAIHKPVMNVVRISTNPQDKEIYEQDKVNHGWAITKKGLEKLMRAAGIKVVDSKPIIPSTCRKCAEMNKITGNPVNCYKCGNKDVAHEVTISVPQLTGENIEITKTKEICVDIVTRGMKPKQAEEFLKFRSEMCETKALNRALRSAMHIKGTYAIEEFQKPFVVAYLVPNLDDPDVKAAAVKKMFSASDKLFARNELPANGATALPPTQEQQSLPEYAEPNEEPPYGEPPPYYEEAQSDSSQQSTNAGCYCANCGAVISQKVFDYSVKNYGVALCMNCQKAQGGGR